MFSHLILVTDDFENIDEGKYLQKMLIFDMRTFLKNFQLQISLMVIGSQEFNPLTAK